MMTATEIIDTAAEGLVTAVEALVEAKDAPLTIRRGLIDSAELFAEIYTRAAYGVPVWDLDEVIEQARDRVDEARRDALLRSLPDAEPPF